MLLLDLFEILTENNIQFLLFLSSEDIKIIIMHNSMDLIQI